MAKKDEYGVVANVLETDRLFRKGAKAWLVGGTGGEGWHRFKWIALTRSPRRAEKWAPTTRFHNFRAAWIPDHMQDRVWYFRGTREEIEELATKLNQFADREREQHPSRRT